MQREWSSRIVLVVLALLVMLGCGGAGQVSVRDITRGGTGSVVIFAGDSPLCDVVSFRTTIIGATLTPQGDGAPVSVIGADQAVTLDFAALLDLPTVINLATVRSGTYSQATLTLANPEMTFLDFAVSPPVPRTLVPTLPTLTIVVDIDPALTVGAGDTVGLEIDFDLLQSLQTDATGLTGIVSPVFRATPLAVSPEGRLRQLEGLRGLVESVTTSSADPAFAGSFVLATLSGTGPTLIVNVTSATTLDGIAELGTLLPGTFVETDGFVDAQGNIVAQVLEVEELPDPNVGRAAFVGPITSVTRTAPPNADEFRIVVREEYPDISTSVPLNKELVVKILPTTNLRLTSDDVNVAGLSFDASKVGLGQEVVVHGNFQAATQEIPAIVNATSVYLRLQPLVGNATSILAAGADGVSGGFALKPCGSLFGSAQITALTFSQTEFAGAANLNALDPARTLIVKGLVFYEQSHGSFGDVSWQAPAWVMNVKKVKQLPSP